MSHMKNAGKLALITGGSRGLGKSMALHLAKNGTDVIITYNRQRADADQVVAEIEESGGKAHAIQLDVSQSASFAGFAETVQKCLKDQWGRSDFDYLVNNAGTSLHASILETTEAQFDEVMNVHVKGTFFLTQKLIPLLKTGGKILNVSSGLTRFSFPGSAAYAAAKGAVEVLTRYLARELGERKITANTIAPGAVATDFSDGRVRDNPEIGRQIAANTALGRIAVADDIGGAVAAFLDGETHWMTGQRIEISGGMIL